MCNAGNLIIDIKVSQLAIQNKKQNHIEAETYSNSHIGFYVKSYVTIFLFGVGYRITCYLPLS